MRINEVKITMSEYASISNCRVQQNVSAHVYVLYFGKVISMMTYFEFVNSPCELLFQRVACKSNQELKML